MQREKKDMAKINILDKAIRINRFASFSFMLGLCSFSELQLTLLGIDAVGAIVLSVLAFINFKLLTKKGIVLSIFGLVFGCIKLVRQIFG